MDVLLKGVFKHYRTKFCATKWLIIELHDQVQLASALLVIIKRLLDFLLIRLENEHLNNVGKYRAFDSVPLPFDYDEMVR